MKFGGFSNEEPVKYSTGNLLNIPTKGNKKHGTLQTDK